MRKVPAGSLAFIDHAAHEARPSTVTFGHLPGGATSLPAACLAPASSCPPLPCVPISRGRGACGSSSWVDGREEGTLPGDQYVCPRA